jgi:molecular chaperone HtpG
MTKEELDKNLGTIAHSGSEQFKEENAEHQGSDMDIIGQFGVGLLLLPSWSRARSAW